jgi:hypothetical protein
MRGRQLDLSRTKMRNILKNTKYQYNVSAPLRLAPLGEKRHVFMYVHIYVDGHNHLRVVSHLMDTCRSFGLLDIVDEVRYYVLGTPENVRPMQDLMSTYPKTVMRGTHTNVARYERETLEALHEDATRATDDAYVFYIHSKGTSAKSYNNPNVERWTDAMINLLARYRHVCMSWLDRGADTVGIMYRELPTRHYSGNFWWSTFSHIRRLHVPIGPCYLDPEMWIASHPDTWSVSLSQHGHDMYGDAPPLQEYLSSVQISHHGHARRNHLTTIDPNDIEWCERSTDP